MDASSLWSDNGLLTSASPLSSVLNDNHLTPQTSRTQSRWLFNSSPGWNITETNNNVNKSSNLGTQKNGSLSQSFGSMTGIGNSNSNNNNNGHHHQLPPHHLNFEMVSEPVTTVPDSARNATAQDFLQRYKHLKTLEGYKNELIEDLLCRYEYLSEQYKKLSDDHDRESEYNRSSQRREKNLQDNLRRLQSHLDRDPFVLVLIDGNDMLFNDQLLGKGEAGGREAAILLNAKIMDRIGLMFPTFQSDVRIVTRIYASVQVLGEVFCKAGIVDHPNRVEEFARGFTSGHPLFDFIDVGNGTDDADIKISELLRLHLHDYQCRQIFFGCSRESGHTRLTEELGTNQYAHERITLLEGIPLQRDAKDLDLEKFRLEGIFRNTGIDTGSQGGPLAKTLSNGVAIPVIAPKQKPFQTHLQLSEADIKDAKEFIPQLSQPRASSLSTESSAKASPVNTWASAVAKTSTAVAPPTPTAANVTVIKQEPVIPRNRKGQRVDPVIKHDKVEVDRVKKLKMCNVHFLRTECPYGDSCSHVHQYKPTAAELQTLRLVARMAPCMHGSDCDDVKCIYGHVCPAPEGRDGKDCIFGDQCRFPPELHRIDRMIVKTIKV